MTAYLPKKIKVLIVALTLFAVSAFFSSASAATFTLSPADGSTVCDIFTVDLNLSELSGKQVSGVDVYLNYEPSKLQAQSVDVTGGVFSNYVDPQIDSTTGTIKIFASATALSPVTQSGLIARISFNALQTSGTTTLSFDYVAGSTTDSNISESGTQTDILTDPGTFTYTLAPSGCGGSSPGSESPESEPTTTPAPSTSTSAPSTAKGGVPEASPTGAPEGGFLEPTLLLSLLSFLMVSSGVVLRVRSRHRTLENFEKKTLRNL